MLRVPLQRSLAQAIDHADLVITVLPNGAIVRDVLTRYELFKSVAPGAVLLEMSSSATTDTRALEAAVQGYLRIVDAPVSGGLKRAIDGTLAIMTGGAAVDQRRVRPVWEKMASVIFDCGPVGAGHAMKSINNFVSGAGVIAASEAVKLGTAFGLNVETIVALLDYSVGSWIHVLEAAG